MSMNLNASCDGNKIDLWQTPTTITYMICVNKLGVANELKGNKAVRALQSYIQWVYGQANGTFQNMDDAEWSRKVSSDHVKYIYSFLDSGGEIRVWIS